MEELQGLSDAEPLTDEISNFTNEINDFHNDLIAREVELLSGLEVGGASLIYFTATRLLQPRSVCSFLQRDSLSRGGMSD